MDIFFILFIILTYLGIQNTANGFLTIGILVNVNVAEPVGMAQDGDLGMVLYVLYQFLAPAGDNEVDDLVLLKQLVDIRSRRDGLDQVRRQTARERLVDDAGEHILGLHRFLSALEDGRIPYMSRYILSFFLFFFFFSFL